MHEFVLSSALFIDLAEPVHVQLPHVTAEVVVFEVFRQNMLRKFNRTLDYESVSFGIPMHNFVKIVFLGLKFSLH